MKQVLDELKGEIAEPTIAVGSPDAADLQYAGLSDWRSDWAGLCKCVWKTLETQPATWK